MRKIIAIVFIFFNTVAYTANIKDAQNVYNRLLQSNGIKYHPMLRLSESKEVNASETRRYITINRGMLNFVRNNAELAIVLGHELGHFLRGDGSSKPSREYAADAIGAKLANKAGYPVCKGAQVLRRFGDKGSSTHPDSASRYKALGC